MIKLAAICLLVFLILSCQHSLKFEPVPMRQVAYAMPSDIFRITLKEGETKDLKKIKIDPRENIISGEDTNTKKPVTISMDKVIKVEKAFER